MLVLVGLGAALFVALLWAVGLGGNTGPTNDGGNHAGGTGLNGFAGLARLAEMEGRASVLSRSRNPRAGSGWLVVTPNPEISGKDVNRIVAAHRRLGPTLVIMPKWAAGPVDTRAPGAHRGWVELNGTVDTVWPGFLDDVTIGIREGLLPETKVLSATGDRPVPIAWLSGDHRILAAFLDDGGAYPTLAPLALAPSVKEPDGDSDGDGSNPAEHLYPLILVFEPDLLDNYGLARPENAAFAERLLATGAPGQAVTFDLSLAGHARSANLLTLAFEPPYLAATLCLLAAALAVGWRAFRRFGPPLAAERETAFGKRALVGHTAALIRRSGRLGMVAEAYAGLVRERLALALGYRRARDTATSEAAIDRALAARAPDSPSASEALHALTAARGESAILAAARRLHEIERTLTR
jgi:hypothetical protein